ncbi:hypothetical protein YC2023_074482 [Brassica napus]
MTESKCQGNIDCREAPHKQPCPVPLACLFGSCICPWKSHSTFHLVKSNVRILEKKFGGARSTWVDKRDGLWRPNKKN